MYQWLRKKVLVCLPQSSDIRIEKGMGGYAKTNLPKHHRPEEIGHVCSCICV